MHSRASRLIFAYAGPSRPLLMTPPPRNLTTILLRQLRLASTTLPKTPSRPFANRGVSSTVRRIYYHPLRFAHTLPTPPLAAAQAMADSSVAKETDYSAWSHADLVARVQELEESLKKNAVQLRQSSPQPPRSKKNPTNTSNNSTTTPPSPQNKPKVKRKFDPSRYSTRLIALKVAYLGGAYNGFEHQPNNNTPLPTVEQRLMEVLLKSRLVAPRDLDDPLTGKIDLARLWPGEEVTQYSKCGRTDRGVSGFGQVIGIRVRSNRPPPKEESTDTPEVGEGEGGVDAGEKPSGVMEGGQEGTGEGVEAEHQDPPKEFDDIKDELPYVQILNRLLPPDIQILAWAPNPPADFSARFSCIGRHYRYFFTNPAVPLPHGGTGSNDPSSPATTLPTLDKHGNFTGILDIPRMQEAAQLFLGYHDFRNFCKVDASKQIQNFKRYIYSSNIVELPSSASASTSPHAPRVYYFDLHGSAFLWHQVRHMIAVLFLIAQHYESPSLITSLLDADTYPRKPLYEMADDRSLVLWDCYFPEGALDWVYGETERGAAARDGLVDSIWSTWHEAKMDEVLKEQLYLATLGWKQTSLTDARLLPSPEEALRQKEKEKEKDPSSASHILVEGGSRVLFRGKYVPVLKRRKMEEVDVLNERYRIKKPEKVGALGKGKKGREYEEREEKELVREAVRMNLAIEAGAMPAVGAGLEGEVEVEGGKEESVAGL